MKKVTLFVLLIIVLPIITYAEDKEVDNVELSNCVSSTSARFILNNEEIKVKFIGIETNEFLITDDLDETNGKSVDDYVCSLLKDAKNIKLEYEPKIFREDKFGRINAWIFVDDVLLEEHLVAIGAAKVAYLYDDYKYNDILIEQEKISKEKGIGIWKKTKEEKEEENEVIEEDLPKNEGFLDAIGNFFKNIFNSIIKICNDIVEDILS